MAKGTLDPHRLPGYFFRPGKGEVQGAFSPLPGAGSGKMEGLR